MGFAAVLWYRVLGRCIAALFFLRFFGLIGAAGMGDGGGGYASGSEGGVS